MYGKILKGLALASTVVAPVASHAADVAPLPVTDWSGIYLGAQVGYLSMDQTGGSWEGDGRADDGPVQGGLYGGVLGFNVQNNAWVFGAELNVLASDADGTLVSDDGEAAEIDVNFLGTAVGRLGMAHDNLLLFGVAGLAVADLDADFEGQGDSATHLGAVVGVGAEYMVHDNWSLRAEYNYVHLFDENYDAAEGTDVEFGGHVVKAGVSFNF